MLTKMAFLLFGLLIGTFIGIGILAVCAVAPRDEWKEKEDEDKQT